MRFALALLLFAAILAPMEARAQNNTLIVSDFDCRPALPCSQSDISFPQTQPLLAMASACVSRYLAPVSGATVFDESSGLNSNGCLTTNAAAFPQHGRVTNIPQCCIRKLPSNICVMHCDVTAQ